MCKNADPKDEKALKLAEKLGVKLTADEKEFAGKQLLKVRAVTQENQSSGSPTRCGTSWPVQSQKKARGLKFRI